MHSFNPTNIDLSAGIGTLSIIVAFLALVVQFAFAITVYQDAAARRQKNHHLWFVAPVIWFLATVIGSVFVAAIYWVMHYSTLASDRRPMD